MQWFLIKINKQVDLFLRLIEEHCREGFDKSRYMKCTHVSGFPVLEIGTTSYYEAKYQEEFLEAMTRNILINPLLDFLFKEKKYDIRWQTEELLTYPRGMSNIEQEKECPVEFFIVKNGKYIAYRYTEMDRDLSIESNLPQNFFMDYHKTGVKEIEKWYHVDWAGELFESRTDKQNTNQYKISVQELFEQYFSREIYDIFLERLKAAISVANDILGFYTIKKLRASNLQLFRNEILNSLDGIDHLNFYEVKEKGDISSTRKIVSLDEKDQRLIYEKFYNCGRKYALSGRSKFAQSFTTSEYLKQAFDDSITLDRTAIVCGYIKAVEQLCEHIIFKIIPRIENSIYYPVRNLSEDEIQYLKKQSELRMNTKPWKVLMKDGNQKFFSKDMTMKNMFYFFDENSDVIFELDKSNSWNPIYECMKNYASFDRNGYFHKDNIDDSRVVERIYNNTLLIIYWLLGGVKMSNDIYTNNEMLEIVDNTFDQLYRRVSQRDTLCYKAELENGQILSLLRVMESTNYEFDKDGYLQNAELKFISTLAYPKDYSEYKSRIDNIGKDEEIIIFDRNNIPKSLWVLERDNKLIKLL